MRILVVNWQDWTHPRAGGAEGHLREVFGRLADRGHRVDLLCSAFDSAPGAETLDGINVIRRGGVYELFNYALPKAYRTLRKNSYDVVIDDLNKVPFYSPLFVDRPVVPLVHHLFGATIFTETNPLFGSYLWLSERPLARVYRRCRFIAVSESTAEDLVARGVRRDSITVVPNGLPDLDWEKYLSLEKTDEPSFVHVGRLKRYKQLELALEAFAHVVVRHPRARFTIAGEGDHRPALERHVERLGLQPWVEFPGWVEADAKWRLLRRAWALLYTSPKEGWGVASLEAQRIGTIAIVSDAPGLRDTVVDRETGRIVPHGDIDALASAMNDAIERPDERRVMEAQATRRAAGYSWERSASDTLTVLERAVRAGARS